MVDVWGTQSGCHPFAESFDEPKQKIIDELDPDKAKCNVCKKIKDKIEFNAFHEVTDGRISRNVNGIICNQCFANHRKGQVNERHNGKET